LSLDSRPRPLFATQRAAADDGHRPHTHSPRASALILGI